MVRGGPTPGKPPLSADERAVSDFVGTLLMVVVVVALGSVVAVLATSALDEPAPSAAALSLVPVSPGDATLRLLHRNGEPIPLGSLSLTLERNGTAAPVPRAAWTTPDASAWRPGDRLSFPLSPAAGSGEQLRVRVVRTDENVLVAEMATRVATTGLAPSATTLAASFSPALLITDGASTTRLAARVSHPGGALAVASVVADLTNATVPSGSAPLLVDLNDEGRRGDLVGGDGVWSALVSLPTGTPRGVYTVSVNATDGAGRVASVPVTLQTRERPVGTSGTALLPGVTFEAPTSANVTRFRLREFAWDRLDPARLDEDAILLRVVGENDKAWSCLLLLDDASGVATAKELRMWTNAGETVYVPRNGTRLPLAGLDLDLLNPVGSLQWVYSSGVADPGTLYPSADVRGDARFLVALFGQDEAIPREQASLITGILSAEVVLR